MFKKIISFLVFGIFVFNINTALANSATCSKETNFSRQNQNILLLSQHHAGQFYFKIINTSSQPVYLNKVIAKPSASAGWSSELDPNHYSIIAIQNKSFLLSCGNLTTNGLNIKECSQVLKICQLNSPIILNGKSAEQGSYWVMENEID